jgi:hypothetical protein
MRRSTPFGSRISFSLNFLCFSLAEQQLPIPFFVSSFLWKQQEQSLYFFVVLSVTAEKETLSLLFPSLTQQLSSFFFFDSLFAGRRK